MPRSPAGARTISRAIGAGGADGFPAGHVRERLRVRVRERLDDISERVFAIDEPIGAARQEGPNFGALTPAAGDDPRHQFVEVRIGDAKMEDAGPPILKIVVRRRDWRIQKLKQLDPDAIGRQKVRLVRAGEARTKNLPDFGYLRLILHEPAKNQSKAHHRSVPVDSAVDVGNGYADVIEGKRRGHIRLPAASGDAKVREVKRLQRKYRSALP